MTHNCVCLHWRASNGRCRCGVHTDEHGDWCANENCRAHLSSSRPVGSVGPGDRQAAPPRADEESSGGAPRRDACVTRLVEFVVWEMRRGDLPPDVQAAAEACAASVLRPEPLRGYAQGTLTVYGVSRDEDGAHPEAHDVFAHQLGSVVADMVKQGCTYLLVEDRDTLTVPPRRRAPPRPEPIGDWVPFQRG